ncbi:anaerobic carbon-monoxide dehydrogenase catalytic subunit [Thiobaca trueperi]|uniref:anaerobic carbon-monoxide dehydrogenase n=1 Tax=Thiobaca trueperi TaxID=127458 RepID=A0A4V2V117_9GAMM|nr:anaerobic carbon-monoxide dehydrogenase catalytic subunit [Thiobaca trueperi]TCT19442.1 carbon-monoxide dehydrogenase catalytic subunit [Thiobaca trueperi]
MSPQTPREARKGFPTKADVMAQTPDPAVRQMLVRMEQLGIETAFDRFDAQKAHCGFGLDGTCCRICNMGPCKVTARSPRGVCGADADLIVARNILRWVAAGVASHGARGREVMLTLKAAAEGRVALPIRGEAKARAIARAFGIDDPVKSLPELAGEIADLLLEDLSRSVPGAHRTLQALAPPERQAIWKALDILPISAYHEVFEALHRTGTGTDGDWENVMRQLLRCGLAFAWSSVLGSSIAMDILYGPPRRDRIAANLGALDPDTVNIAIHGHSPVLPMAIVAAADDPELRALASARGATGIRFYGICCSGLSSLYRHGGVSPLANAIGAELVLGTGALDLWIADVQDVYPGIMDVARCFHTRVVTTSDSCRLPGATHIGFDHHHANLAEVHELARRIVRMGIDQFPQRRAANVFVPRQVMEAEIGFSVESITESFDGLPNLLAALADGRVRGIVNLVGCNNPKVLYEKTLCEVADALLAADCLILTNGCASFPLLKLGYCTETALERTGPGLRALLGERGLPPVWHMGECLDNARASGLFRALADLAGQPIKAMPFAFASPEWSNEKGVGAALGFRLLGVPSYHCVPAPIGGSAAVSRFFHETTQDALGAAMVVERDPQRLAQRIIDDLSRAERR